MIDRPNDPISVTNNWRYEPLVANRLTGDAVVGTDVSNLCRWRDLNDGLGHASGREKNKQRPPP